MGNTSKCVLFPKSPTSFLSWNFQTLFIHVFSGSSEVFKLRSLAACVFSVILGKNFVNSLQEFMWSILFVYTSRTWVSKNSF